MRRLLFKTLLPFPNGCAAGLAAGMVFALVVQSLGIALPLIVRWAIQGIEQLPASASNRFMFAAVGLLGGIAIARGVFRSAQNFVSAKAAHRILAAVRERMFAHLQRLPLPHLEGKDPGRILVRFIGDANSLTTWLSQTLVCTPADVLAIFVCFAILWHFHPQLAIAFMLPPALMIPVVLVINPQARRTTRSARREQSKLCGALNSFVPDLRWIKAAGLEGTTMGCVGRHVQEIARLRVQRTKYDALLDGAAYGVSACGVAAVVVTALWLLRAGSLQQSDLWAAAWLSLHARAPANRLFKANVIHQRAMVALERIGKLLEREPEKGWSQDQLPYQGPGLAIEVKNLGYQLGSTWAIRQFSASFVSPGLVVLRADGASRYLFDLLLRIRRPHRGSILLDGIDLRKLRVDDLRRHIRLIDCGRADTAQLARRLRAYCREKSFANRLTLAWAKTGPLAPQATLGGLYDQLGGRNAPLDKHVEFPGNTLVRLLCALALMDDPPVLLIEEPFRHFPAQQRPQVAEWISSLANQRLVFVSSSVDVDEWHGNRLDGLNEYQRQRSGDENHNPQEHLAKRAVVAHSAMHGNSAPLRGGS